MVVTSRDLLLMSPEEYQAHIRGVKEERKEKVRELKTQIRQKKAPRKKRRFKSFAKTYKALEKAIRGKKTKIKTLKKSIIEKRLRQGIERRKVNILARIEDKIPRTFFMEKEEKEENHKMSFLGKM